MIQYRGYFLYSTYMGVDPGIMPESLEAAEAKRRADADFERRWNSADFWADAEKLRKSLWMQPFVAPDERREWVQIASIDPNSSEPYGSEIHDDTLYDINSPEWEIYDRIASRIDTEFWWNSEILVPELLSDEARERNSEEAEKFFFSPEILAEQFWNVWNNTPRNNAKINQEWFETNIWDNGPLKDSFERIKSNFILPDHIKWKNLQEVFENNPEDPFIVHDALSDAFMLEIHQHVLKGRVNYPEEKVNSLVKDLTDPDTLPLEKLQIFWEIHTTVNTEIWKGAKKQTEAFRRSQTLWRQEALRLQERHAAQVAKIERNTVKAESDDDWPWEEEKLLWNWDIFQAWVLDIWNNRNKQKEAA